MSQTKVKSGLLNFPDQTDFVKLPSGNTAQRPSSPEEGYSRYNTTDNKLEFWNGTIWQQLPGVVPPIITSISYPGDDLAADPAGGQTITINGSDFKAGATVTVDGTTPSVITLVSATEITFTAPSKTAGDYDVVVTNEDSGNATAVDGMTYNGLPSWTTPAGNLGTFEENTTIPTITLVAAEPDSGAISYSITTGGLPTGLSLAGDDIDGTTPAVAGETTYNFTVTATDNENQSTERAFNIVVYKFVPSFNTVLYTGNGGTQSFNTGFQPDFIWFKARNFDWFHISYDSVRGSNKGLVPSGTSAEFITTDGLASFNENGFTISGGGWITNRPGYNYVAWCWRAGGAAVTNTDGTITSQVSANPRAGFSIVSFNTPSTNQIFSIGHGLENTPKFILTKERDGTLGWIAYHENAGFTNYLVLNTTQSATGGAINVWGTTPPNSTVFEMNTGTTINVSKQAIAYCFAEVAGFSKFGSYSGNGSTQSINVGFAPAFVMFKRTDSTGEWTMIDNKRNNGDNWLYANLSNAEGVNINRTTLNSTGFALDGSPSSCNESGSTYIYMAFANQF